MTGLVDAFNGRVRKVFFEEVQQLSGDLNNRKSTMKESRGSEFQRDFLKFSHGESSELSVSVRWLGSKK